jgi:HEAT repeat protein
LASAAAAHCQEPPSRPDPVDALWQALRAPVRGAAARDSQVTAAVERLRTFDELRRALQLSEWRDRDPDESVAAVDARHRAAIVAGLQRAVRAALRQGDLDERLRAVKMLGELDPMARGAGEAPLTRDFTADLVELTGPGPAALRELAARTLGRLNAEPTSAAAALRALLKDPDPWLRAAGAEALGALVATAVKVDAAQEARDPRHLEVMRAASAVVPVVGRGLTDVSAEVRRSSGEALAQAAEVLGALVDEPVTADSIQDWPAYQREVDAEREVLRPLTAALQAESAALARSAGDGDARVRIVARRALEEMAGARWRLVRRASSAVAGPQAEGDPAAGERSAAFLLDDPLAAGLRQALPALAAGATDDPDVEGRRAAIDVLEALGRQAAPAAPALVAALADRDRFVRWAAARALGKVRTTNTETVVPALVRLLKDGDLDVGLAAVNALAAYGPGARTALTALAEAAHASEPEMRLAAMRALERIGCDDATSLAVLNAALTDSDGRVRQVAGELLEKMGPSRRQAADALLRPPVREGTGAKAVGSVQPR